MNTPSHHRVHHACNPKYIDRNYAGTLIVWDRLFGTFKQEEDEPVYGITKPLRSWNPLWANLHVWVDLAGKARRTARLADRVRLFLRPPGWQPDDLGGFEPPPEVDRATYRKFATPVPRGAGRLRLRAVRAGARRRQRAALRTGGDAAALAGGGRRWPRSSASSRSAGSSSASAGPSPSSTCGCRRSRWRWPHRPRARPRGPRRPCWFRRCCSGCAARRRRSPAGAVRRSCPRPAESRSSGLAGEERPDGYGAEGPSTATLSPVPVLKKARWR